MGACDIWVKQRGKSMLDAFKTAHDESAEEHGHEQGYSGAINSCELQGDYTRPYREAVIKGQGQKYLEDLQSKAGKREVYGVCLADPVESKLKIKTKVIRTPQKGARIYQTVYTAYDFMGDNEVIQPQKTLSLAIKEARIWSEKNDRRCSVFIEKRLVKGNSKCADIEVKKDGKKKDGVYLFVGLAPC